MAAGEAVELAEADGGREGDAVTEAEEYDAFDLRRPRKKRISKFTNKPTKLYPETELQIAMMARYNKQCAFDKRLREKTLVWAVSPNDGKRSARQAGTAKDMGQRADIFDIHMLDWRTGDTKYFWFEVKIEERRNHKDGGLSAGQKKLFDMLKDTTVQRHVLYTVDEFAYFLENP